MPPPSPANNSHAPTVLARNDEGVVPAHRRAKFLAKRDFVFWRQKQALSFFLFEDAARAILILVPLDPQTNQVRWR